MTIFKRPRGRAPRGREWNFKTGTWNLPIVKYHGRAYGNNHESQNDQLNTSCDKKNGKKRTNTADETLSDMVNESKLKTKTAVETPADITTDSSKVEFVDTYEKIVDLTNDELVFVFPDSLLEAALKSAGVTFHKSIPHLNSTKSSSGSSSKNAKKPIFWGEYGF